MRTERTAEVSGLSRRSFLHLGVAGLSAAVLRGPVRAREQAEPTEFQIACMTLP